MALDGQQRQGQGGVSESHRDGQRLRRLADDGLASQGTGESMDERGRLRTGPTDAVACLRILPCPPARGAQRLCRGAGRNDEAQPDGGPRRPAESRSLRQGGTDPGRRDADDGDTLRHLCRRHDGRDATGPLATGSGIRPEVGTRERQRRHLQRRGLLRAAGKHLYAVRAEGEGQTIYKKSTHDDGAILDP